MNETNPKPKPGTVKKARLGDHLVASGLITTNDLEQGLQRQGQAGGKLGSNLIEMGFLEADDLIEYLSKKYGVPGLNLFSIDIDTAVLALVSREKMQRYTLLPVSDNAGAVTLAMANPMDQEAIKDIGFALGRKVIPVVSPAFMLEAAIRNLLNNPEQPLIGHSIAETVNLGKGEKHPSLNTLLQYMLKIHADDLLLTSGTPPSLKISNQLRRLSVPALTPADCEKYARELVPYKEWETFLEKQDHGLSVTVPGIGRFRTTIYKQRDAIAIAIRPILDKIPSLEELNLPAWIADFALRPHGLILISGPAGHGKSTTLSALVDIINTRKGSNIITLEDPIEFIHKHKKSNINQREIGRDVASFSEGMKHVLRQAPDVIVVGEMRDRETFEIALQASNSGHLVISTVHSDNATSIVERVINMFEPHEQAIVRTTLAESFLLSIAQRLIPKKNRDGRALAVEKLTNSRRVRKMIREGKTHQIRSQMQVGGDDFVPIDIALANLCKQGIIAYEDGAHYVDNEKLYQDLAGK